MEVITIDSKAFNEIISQLTTISKFVLSNQGNNEKDEANEWVDNYEVCTFLQISERTLQRLRAKGEISYSRIRGRTYYKVSEVRRMLEEKLVRSKKEYLNNMLIHHRQAREKRQKGKNSALV